MFICLISLRLQFQSDLYKYGENVCFFLFSQDNAQTVSKNLTTVTSSPTELNETDVDLAVDVLENLVRSINEYESAEVVENAVDAINNLAGAMMETLVAGQRDAEIATR